MVRKTRTSGRRPVTVHRQGQSSNTSATGGVAGSRSSNTAAQSDPNELTRAISSLTGADQLGSADALCLDKNPLRASDAEHRPQDSYWVRSEKTRKSRRMVSAQLAVLPQSLAARIELLHRMEALEQRLAELSPLRFRPLAKGQVAHLLLRQDERMAIKNAIDILRAQPFNPTPASLACALRAATKIQTVGERICIDAANNTATAKRSESEDRFLTSSSGCAFACTLIAVAAGVRAWIASADTTLS
jgi:hypothetical protein